METGMDQKKSEMFAQSLIETVNRGALTLMISIGHRTGLFDLMAGKRPMTSIEIAEEGSLNERYVREWLGAMTVGKIVDFDPEAKTYRLPDEHAAWLTRKSSPNNIAVTMQWMGVLAPVESDIAACFRTGGGVPYEKFNRFHEVMAEESQQTVVLPLFDHILPLAEGITEKLERGIDVLDLGCGSGYALSSLAAAFPRSRFTGYDFFEEAVEGAKQRASLEGLTNLRFEIRDAAQVDDHNAFDFILTFDAIHDQKRPDAVLANIFRALRPGGIYLMQDIAGSSFVEKNMDHPVSPFLYTISTMHCMTVSMAQEGAALGTLWGRETATEMLRKAGFEKIEIKKLEHDFINDYYIIRK